MDEESFCSCVYAIDKPALGLPKKVRGQLDGSDNSTETSYCREQEVS